MENTEVRLIQENQQLRIEKEQNLGNLKIRPQKVTQMANKIYTPPINEEESVEKQSEIVKKGKKIKRY